MITFDHEHVPLAHLRALEADGVTVRPGPDALVHAQDKGVMRERLTALGVPCPRHRIVADPADVSALRRRRSAAIRSSSRPSAAATTARACGSYGPRPTRPSPSGPGVPVLAEEKVDFVRELAANVVRSPHGQAVAYPVVESQQVNGVCDTVIAPAPGLSEELSGEAQELALRIAKRAGRRRPPRGGAVRDRATAASS